MKEINLSAPVFPGAEYIDTEESAAVQRVIASKRLFRYYGVDEGESEAAAYEQEWASAFGVKNALAVNSGTSALMCALRAAGIGAGDEVIVPAYTWIATAAAVVELGAKPIVAAVDATLTLDVDDARSRITPKTRAIVPVHMRGTASNMAAVLELARENGLFVIEDACQAIGATYKGTRLGTLGDVGCYSTQYAKIITTGEGGMLVTNNADLHRNALDVHDCKNAGRRGESPSDVLGLSLRCSELTAAVGRVQLGRLDKILNALRANRDAVVDSLEASSAVMLRPVHDSDGDAGAALVFIAESAEAARVAVKSMSDGGLSCEHIWFQGSTDQHVFPAWKAIWAAVGEPETDPALQASVDLMSRAVHIAIHPMWTADQCRKVAKLIDGALALNSPSLLFVRN